MQLPRISVTTTPGQIQIERTPSKLEIQQPKAEVSIEQPRGEMEIERKPGQLTIDQTEAWASIDLKSIKRRILEQRDKGYEDWLEGVGRRSGEGDELMKIENGFTAIADISQRNAYPEPFEWNLGWIPPIGSVQIDNTPTEVKTHYTPKKPIIDIKPQQPMIQYTPGSVTTSMKQYPSLQISYFNLGQSVDQSG